MKTNYFNIRQISLYSILGFLGLAVTSCSSYQNTSSYDSDGIYGSVPRDSNNEPVYTYNDGTVTQYNDGNNSGQNMNYKAYFQSLQNEYPAYTDTDGYTSYDNDTIVQVEGYGGWGEETDDVTVNIYGGYGYGGYGWNNWYSPYWGYSGWGWGSGWGLGIGWGYGGWGWGLGWNSWYSPYYYGGWGWGGWGYPYYGHYGYPHYHYGNNYGRSNVAYSGGRSDYYNRGRYATGRRNAVTSVNSRRQTTATASGRRYDTSRNTTVRSRGDATYSEGRTNTRSTRNSDFSNSSRSRNNNSFTPSRSSSSPSRSSGTISSPSRSSGGSFGGGRSSGGGGGSRGGGGGRRG